MFRLRLSTFFTVVCILSLSLVSARRSSALTPTPSQSFTPSSTPTATYTDFPTFTATSTFTLTNTQFPTSTPTSTNTPTNTATPFLCPDVSKYRFEFLLFQDLGLVKMQLTNNDTNPTQIIGFSVNWRSVFSGMTLARAYGGTDASPYNGIPMWQGNDTAPPTTADGTTAGWQNNIFIPAGTTKAVWFDFEGTFGNLGSLGAVPADFNGSTLLLPNSCVVTLQFGSGVTPYATLTPTATISQTPPSSRTDTIGVYKNGVFSLRNSNSGGAADISATFGGDVSDLPVAGDWNSDGVDSIGVYRGNTGVFFLSDSNTAPTTAYSLVFGNPGDTPFAGRWDNTMTGSGVGVYRNSNGVLYQKKTLTTGVDDFFAIFGNPGDQGVAGDWNGDGFDSVGIYRSSSQTWYLSNNATPGGIIFSNVDFVWNIGSAAPVVGDWDGNGTTTPGYYNELSVFVLRNSNNTNSANDNAFVFGAAGGKPIAGKWTAPSRPAPISGVIVGGSSGGYVNPIEGGDAD